MAEVTSLPVFRFLNRLKKSREDAQQLTSLATDASTQLKGMNEQLKRNVEAQRILNKHLAASNKARKPKATLLQFPNR